jgi:hypothetical protein
MLDHIEFIYIAFFLTIGTFVVAFMAGWFANNLFDAWYQNAGYAKSITHPEMLDEDGQILRDELIYLTFSDDDDMLDDEDE